jgi:hypothetical protein
MRILYGFPITWKTGNVSLTDVELLAGEFDGI